VDASEHEDSDVLEAGGDASPRGLIKQVQVNAADVKVCDLEQVLRENRQRLIQPWRLRLGGRVCTSIPSGINLKGANI
jgi:hypothetical protein